MTVEVMGEIGIDLSGHRSKHVDELPNESFDVIITTCDDARDQCPVYPGEGERLHWGLEDPAGAKRSREEKLEAFRKVRDRLIELIHARFLTDSR
jgi:arsenate reductase